MLGLDFGLASGPYQGTDRAWLRCFATDGTQLPSGVEAEAQRAEAVARRTAELAAKLAVHEARFGPPEPRG